MPRLRNSEPNHLIEKGIWLTMILSSYFSKAFYRQSCAGIVATGVKAMPNIKSAQE